MNKQDQIKYPEVGGTNVQDSLFVKRLRQAGLTDKQIEQVLKVVDNTCNQCWNNHAKCQCWNDR
jgi:hypothetical protein